jgi:hypothetical protein
MAHSKYEDLKKLAKFYMWYCNWKEKYNEDKINFYNKLEENIKYLIRKINYC